jgi:hypothetical protein
MFDIDAPVTAATAVLNNSAPYVFNTLTSSPYVNVTLACTDPGAVNSGCNVSLYCIDAANACVPGLAYSAPFQVPAGNTTYIRYYSRDNAANNETVRFAVVRAGTAPTILIPANIIAEATSPTGANVTYLANATDSSGAAINVTCAPASGSAFPMGLTTVTCNASDSAGNIATASFTVTVRDSTPPVTTASATTSNGLPFTLGTSTSLNVSVTLACTDASSGCNKTFYCVDNVGTCSPYNAGIGATYPAGGINLTAIGTYFVKYQSIDNAANLEVAKSSIVVIVPAATCLTTADTNGDLKISSTELVAYIGLWRLGNVTSTSLVTAIGFWRTGTGC